MSPISKNKDFELLISTGWALVAVFIVTLIGTALPIQIRNVIWGQNLSRGIVDSAAVVLVGLCLARYGIYLMYIQSRRLPSSPEQAGTPASRVKPGTPQVRYQQSLRRSKQLVTWLARLGAMGMALLALWQPALFLQALSNVEGQLSAASAEQLRRADQLEQALRNAPAAELEQAWFQLKRINPADPPAVRPDQSQQRRELLANLKNSKDSATANLTQQANSARFDLVRERLRVGLVALIFAAALWLFVRKTPDGF